MSAFEFLFSFYGLLLGLSIAELAHRLGRSEGAVKQLQWRGLRSLSRRLPADVRH